MSEERLQEAMSEFDRIAEKIQKSQQNRARLMTQQNENEAVARELEAAADDAVIYKVVGPVLVRQTKADAESTVKKRLEYVKGELQRCDKIEADMKQQFQEATQRVETIQKKILERQRQKGRQ